MARNNSELRDLVADANHIIAYAARNGVILPPGLLAATFQIETHLADNTEPTNDDTAAFITSLNLAANTIRPVTLVDLGSKWKPFGGAHNSVVVRTLMSVAAILIIGLAGYYTHVYVLATQAFGELSSIQSQAPADKAARLYRMYLHNKHLLTDNPGENDDLHYEPYLRAKEALLGLDDDILTTQTGVYHLDKQSNIVATLMSGLKKAAGPPPVAAIKAPRKPPPPPPAPGPTAQVAAAPGHGAHAAPPAKAPPVAVAAISSDHAGASDQPQSEEDFLVRIGAPNVATLVDPIYSISGNTLTFQIEKVRELVETLGTLFLPTLFGMIGTIVFELRRMLNPMTPNDPVERMVVRTALGGLAGLSITFVLRPLHMLQDDAGHSGMGVFAVAFVLGFSIDVFFALLDKLVSTLSQSIAGTSRT